MVLESHSVQSCFFYVSYCCLNLQKELRRSAALSSCVIQMRSNYSLCTSLGIYVVWRSSCALWLPGLPRKVS